MAASANQYRIAGMVRTNLLTSSGGGTPTLVRTQVNFVNGVEFESDIRTIEFEGDGQVKRSYKLASLSATVTADTLDIKAITTVFSIDEVTSGLETGRDNRVYFGTTEDESGVKCGIEFIVIAENIATNVILDLAIVIPVGTLSTLSAPNLANIDKAPMELQFSADKTADDIVGTALVGVPTGGAFWYVEELV